MYEVVVAAMTVAVGPYSQPAQITTPEDSKNKTTAIFPIYAPLLFIPIIWISYWIKQVVELL